MNPYEELTDVLVRMGVPPNDRAFIYVIVLRTVDAPPAEQLEGTAQIIPFRARKQDSAPPDAS